MASREINDISVINFYTSDPVGHVEGTKPVHPRFPVAATTARPLPERSKKSKKPPSAKSEPDTEEGSIIDDYA